DSMLPAKRECERRRAPPRLRRGQKLVRSRRRCGRRQARGYLQLRQSLRRAWHRARLPACAPADSDNQRSAVTALPDAPPSPAVEPATCKRRASAWPGPLPRLVTPATEKTKKGNGLTLVSCWRHASWLVGRE